MRTMKEKLTLFLVISLLLTSCSTEKAPGGNPEESTRGIADNQGNTVAAVTANPENTDFRPVVDLSEFDRQTETEDAVQITLNGTSASCASDSVTIEDGRITVTDEGSYILTGTYTGQIAVQAGADDNVQLILSDANIVSDMAPIYVSNCKNSSITLAEGTVNTISDSQNYTFADGADEPDAAIFSDCDLTINGEGTLNVTGNYACGIRTKDDLRIVSGNISVTSAGDAVKGRDSLQIAGGNIDIVSAADGLKSNNDEDSERGYIVIDGGNFNISAGDDGVHAESWLIINGGNLTVTESSEGLEAMKVELNGGNIDITASDDALNAASPSAGENEADGWFGKDQRQNGGRGGFAGMNPPDGMTMPEGMEMPQMPEGTAQPEIPADGGTTGGFNRSGRGDRDGNTGGKGGGMGGFGGMMGGMGNETPEDGVWIRITGGNIRLYGGVDVLDSNGTIDITGGTVIADTPRLQIYGNPDSIFDANGETAITGGTYAAYAQSTGSITQITKSPSLTVSGRISAGMVVEVKDSAGNAIFSDIARNGGSVFFFTSDQLKSGETYTVITGESVLTVTAK